MNDPNRTLNELRLKMMHLEEADAKEFDIDSFDAGEIALLFADLDRMMSQGRIPTAWDNRKTKAEKS